MSCSGYEMFRSFQKRLVEALHRDSLMRDRVEPLMTIPGIGELTALTWILEIGDTGRFTSIRKDVSYCGLCSTQRESAGKEQRGPISKKRNKHLQTMLIEAAKLAPHWNEQLSIVHERELKKGDRNRAMLAVDKKHADFKLPAEMQAA